MAGAFTSTTRYWLLSGWRLAGWETIGSSISVELLTAGRDCGPEGLTLELRILRFIIFGSSDGSKLIRRLLLILLGSPSTFRFICGTAWINYQIVLAIERERERERFKFWFIPHSHLFNWFPFFFLFLFFHRIRITLNQHRWYDLWFVAARMHGLSVDDNARLVYWIHLIHASCSFDTFVVIIEFVAEVRQWCWIRLSIFRSLV